MGEGTCSGEISKAFREHGGIRRTTFFQKIEYVADIDYGDANAGR